MVRKMKTLWGTVAEAGMARDAKTILYDGRTGEPFDNRVSVGLCT